jgi:drug/metabolite transporter (DMT)-like permease
MSSAFKITLRYIEYDQLLLWSSLFGIIALALFSIIQKKSLRIAKIDRKSLLSSAIMGLFNPFLYYFVLFKAYDLLEAQIAGTLNYFWPIALVLLSIPFLGQKIKTVSIIAIFISFFGLIIISMQGEFRQFKILNPFGVALAVGSAFFWAVYWILNMKDKRKEVEKILLNLCFGFLFILIYILIVKQQIMLPEAKAFIGIVYIGLFEMSITFVIWLKALQYSSDTAKVSNLIYLSPFIALFIIHFVVGEQIHFTTVIGLTIVVTGILIQQISARRLKR